MIWDPNFFEQVWNPNLAGRRRGGARTRLPFPHPPFGWIDRPPSLNRMMGFKWLGHTLYPEASEGDLREETRAFYRTWYHIDLDVAALDMLLESAEGRS